MITFQEFLKENNLNKLDTGKLTYQEFLKSVLDSCVKDFDMDREQAIEFSLLYKELLKDAWEKEYTTREAIASTKRPGVMLKQDVKESFYLNIDDVYEDYIEKIKSETKSENIEAYINEYYNKFTEPYSDKRIFERVKNNYKRLKILSDKRIFEMQYTNDVGTLEVDVIERNDKLIDDIINSFSFVYRKIKDRYLRPIKITGKTLYKDVELEVFLSNKDVVKITWDDTEDAFDELKVHINNKLVYHMDYIDDENIVKRTLQLYKNYLINQNFKIVTKLNPFE